MSDNDGAVAAEDFFDGLMTPGIAMIIYKTTFHLFNTNNNVTKVTANHVFMNWLILIQQCRY